MLGYSTGLSFAPSPGFRGYWHDAMILCGIALFLILIGLAMFVFFREHLPKRGRWIVFGAVVSLFPLAIISIFFFSPCYQTGRGTAFSRLDMNQLQADAMEIQRLFPLNNKMPRDLAEGNPDISTLPLYTQNHLHPAAVHICPGGVALRVDSGSDFEEGVIIATGRLSAAYVASIAKANDYTVLSELPPVFRFPSGANTEFLEAKGSPATHPAFTEPEPESEAAP